MPVCKGSYSRVKCQRLGKTPMLGKHYENIESNIRINQCFGTRTHTYMYARVTNACETFTLRILKYTCTLKLQLGGI